MLYQASLLVVVGVCVIAAIVVAGVASMIVDIVRDTVRTKNKEQN